MTGGFLAGGFEAAFGGLSAFGASGAFAAGGATGASALTIAAAGGARGMGLNGAVQGYFQGGWSGALKQGPSARWRAR